MTGFTGHGANVTRRGNIATGGRAAVDDLRQLVLTQDTGLERTWHITSWTPNATLPKGTFTFEVPSGAKVVGQAAFRPGR